jgi:zinc-finger of transposase IS204/IS1001/IS1096/IS1165
VADEIMLTLRTTSPTASCPSCGTLSTRVQSRYTRRLHDLPSSGRPVSLMLHVRRFFCSKGTCAQKIFTERLPELCRPHAQRTIQLQKALCQLGLAAGGQAGAEIGSEQGMSGSRDTILRLVRRHQLPDPPTSRIVGIDDWGATRSCMSSCKDSRKEDLTWGSAPSAEPSLNQVRLGQGSHVRKDGD